MSCPCAANLTETAADVSLSDTSNSFKSGERRKSAKKASAGPVVVAQAAGAAIAGPLPDVLAATFPVTFPTLSAARRGM